MSRSKLMETPILVTPENVEDRRAHYLAVFEKRFDFQKAIENHGNGLLNQTQLNAFKENVPHKKFAIGLLKTDHGQLVDILNSETPDEIPEQIDL